MKLGYRVKRNSLLSGIASSNRSAKPAPTKKTHSRHDEESLEEKVDKLFSGQDLLFERLHSEPKWTSKTYRSAKVGVKSASIFVRKQTLVAKVVAVGVSSLLVGGMYWGANRGQESTVIEVAGVSDTQANQGIQAKLPELKPPFSVVLPGSKTTDDFSFVKVSPEGSAPVYAFVDTLGSTDIKVSQQELPENFIGKIDAELEKLANSFQATSIIQIDDTRVYHGLSEKLGVQSLIFVRGNRLIFISSPAPLSDDIWVGYITSMK